MDNSANEQALQVSPSTAQDNELLEAEKILNGGDDYTEHMVIRYLLNLMKNTPVQTPAAYRFCYAAARTFQDKDLEKAGFPAASAKVTKGQKRKPAKDVYEFLKKPTRDSVDAKDWDTLKKFLEERLAENPEVEEPTTLKNLMRLADFLGFQDEEKEVLRLLYVSEDYDFDSFLGAFASNDLKMVGPMVARALDQPKAYKKVGRLLGEDSPLIKYGLYYQNSNQRFLPESDEDLYALLSKEDLDDETLVGSILGKPAQTALTLDDFGFIGKDLDFIADLIGKAAEQGRPGINVLIYGPPGGGKTELAKALAQSLKLKLYSVGEEESADKERSPIYDSDGDFMGMSTSRKNEEKVSKQRLSQLMRAHALLKGNDKAIVLFDEIEDLLIKGTDTEKKADTDSKIEVNRLLENNPVVTIWTGNDTDKFHEAVRDRFSFSLFVDYPPTLVRRKMWQRQLDINNVKMPEGEVLELARRYDATPRQIAKAVKAAAITGKGMEAIDISMPASSKISRGNSDALSGGNRISQIFSPALLNVEGADGKERISALVEAAAAHKPFALMVTGPRGTGVHSMTRYIGEQMTLNVLELSMAGLSQPTQFSSPEGNVQSAFNAAADSRSFLVIRDIEHLVSSPESRTADWQNNSLVDTFMRCALTHKLPFAVTCQKNVEFPQNFTSLFPDRIALRPLDSDKAKEAFKAYFNREAPATLPQNLVLSDFANARRLAARQGDALGAEQLADMLRQQQGFRALSNQKLGF